MYEDVDKNIQYINAYLEVNSENINEELQEILKIYKRKSERLEKIIKHSDKQQFTLMQLNEKITQINEYDKQQQMAARKKLMAIVVDDLKKSEKLKSQVIFKPLDILSGDFYSTYSLKDGSTFAYVIDGQGHGASPALTVFAVSSTITNLISKNLHFEDIMDLLFPSIKKFLGEEEQLSFSMICIDAQQKVLHYSIGGMYPILIKQKDKIIECKANSLPFMNFSQVPDVTSILLEEWSDILLYSDGLVENFDLGTSEITPHKLIENTKLFDDIKKLIDDKTFDDDITLLHIAKLT